MDGGIKMDWFQYWLIIQVIVNFFFLGGYLIWGILKYNIGG